MAAYIRRFIPPVSQVLSTCVKLRCPLPSTSILACPQLPSTQCTVMQTRCFAARKGTRDKKLKLKKARKQLLQARAAQKEASASANRRTTASKAQLPSRLRTSLDLSKPDKALDDVWLSFAYKRWLYPLNEAVEMYRETHHPTTMDLPDALLYLSLELNLTSDKKNKFLDKFNGVVRFSHFDDYGKSKSVIAFAKDEVSQHEAMDAGADMVGGIPLIKRVQGGEALLADYKYIVAHPNILLDLTPLRGLMKKRFPNTAKNTLGADMKALVEHFKKGVEYVCERDNVQPDFGWVDVPVGKISLPMKHIEKNVSEIISDVCLQRDPKLGPFVTVAVLTCPPSKEKIIVDVTPFLPSVPDEDIDDDEEASNKI